MSIDWSKVPKVTKGEDRCHYCARHNPHGWDHREAEYRVNGNEVCGSHLLLVVRLQIAAVGHADVTAMEWTKLPEVLPAADVF